MPLGRRPRETDWQEELKAGCTARPLEPANPAKRKLRVSPGLIVALDIVVWLIATAAEFWLRLFGHSHTGKAALSAGVVIALQLPLAVGSWRRRKARELREQQAHELEESMVGRLDRRLEMIAGELKAFLVNPPRRVVYQHWLQTATNLLDRNSQDAAFDWGQLDVDWNSTAELVSTEELSARRELLLDLYTKVATPEQVAVMRNDLPQAPRARAITSS